MVPRNTSIVERVNRENAFFLYTWVIELFIEMQFELWSTSKIEVARFRYFISERRGSWTQSRRNVNLDSEKKTFCRLGPWDY